MIWHDWYYVTGIAVTIVINFIVLTVIEIKTHKEKMTEQQFNDTLIGYALAAVVALVWPLELAVLTSVGIATGFEALRKKAYSLYSKKYDTRQEGSY